MGTSLGTSSRVKSSLRKSSFGESLKPVFLAAVCLILLSVSGVAQNTAASPERELFNATNRERQAHGLPALQWNDALAVAARKHASEMAQKDALSHQFPGEPSLPSRVKQAALISCGCPKMLPTDPMHGRSTEFVKSPNHRANILDSDMNVMGVGIVERNGEMFAVEDFSKAK